MAKTKITGRYIIGWSGSHHQILENGEIVFDKDTILFVGFDYPEPVDKMIEAGNAVVGPGFVDLDALADLDSAMLGFDNGPPWKKGRVWASTYVDRGSREVYTPEEENLQKRYAFTQLLLNGITTALPITSLLYREWGETYDEFTRSAETAAELGLRIYLGPAYRTGLSVVYPDGRFGVHWNEERGLKGLEDAIRFVKNVDGRDGGLIRGMLAPDRIECCTVELLQRTAEASHELDCPVRLHCCQSKLEVETVHERFGKSTIEVLKELGFLSRRALLPHGRFLGGIQPIGEKVKKEVEWIREAGATIVHCPIVCGRHAMFKYPIAKWKSWGINVGLGTDTFPPDFIRNMHTGIMLSRVINEDILSCSAADYYQAATIGGANAIGRSDLGRLYPGAKADLTVFDLSGFHLGQFVDPVQTMVMNGTGMDFKTVIVNGRIVVDDRKLNGLCFEELQEKAQRQYDKLRSTYPERTLLHPRVDDIFRPSFPVVRRSGQAQAGTKP